MCELTLRVVFKVQLSSSFASSQPLELAIMTTSCITLCLEALVTHRRLKQTSNPARAIANHNISLLAETSHDAIVQQNMLYAHYEGIDLGNQRGFYNTLAAMVFADNSWELVKALQKYKFIPRSVALAKSSLSILTEPGEDKEPYDWHYHIAQAWYHCLEHLRLRHDLSPAFEAIDLGMLFVLERWGCTTTAQTQVKGKISELCTPPFQNGPIYPLPIPANI